MENPRTTALMMAALALFMAGLLLAAYAAGWPRSTVPPTVLITPF
ncbi:MAG TPA: hypothetical protein VGJ34_00875 [Gaiellaceae bacterium]